VEETAVGTDAVTREYERIMRKHKWFVLSSVKKAKKLSAEEQPHRS